MPLGTEQAALGAPTTWAFQSIGVKVTFQPKRADAVVQEFADRKVYHAPIIPQPARWLHMSRGYIATAITGVFRDHFINTVEAVATRSLREPDVRMR
jgi:hypothetical protein